MYNNINVLHIYTDTIMMLKYICHMYIYISITYDIIINNIIVYGIWIYIVLYNYKCIDIHNYVYIIILQYNLYYYYILYYHIWHILIVIVKILYLNDHILYDYITILT